MAMTATYTNFGGMLVHEVRNGVETEYVPDTLGNLAMALDMSNNITYKAEYWPYWSAPIREDILRVVLSFAI